jgi:hypothetical protein
MKTQTTKENAMTTTKTTKASETYDWLTATCRNGRRRIETLGWKRLASLYYAARPDAEVRRAIEREARRCGYTPRAILGLHYEG